MQKSGILGKLKRLFENDITRKKLIICIAVMCALKLLLCGFQMIEICPGTYIDDELMLTASMNIGDGAWLGDYYWMTMAKHMFFSIWLLALNRVGIPLLVGNAALYIAACFVCLYAARPVIKKNLSKLLFFFMLCYCPYSWASCTLRVYRDSIFPSLCLLFFGGMLGFCLRYKSGIKSCLPFGIFAGVGLGLACLTREDAMWLYPFAICAALVYVIFVLAQKTAFKEKLKRLLCVLSIALSVAACIVPYCAMNYKYYGRFIISDYSSPEFTAALSAMIRADTDMPHTNLIICRATRDKLAKAVPLMKQLCDTLDNGEYYHGFKHGDEDEFGSGGYFWMFRKAAYDAGLASTPLEARDFWATLAKDVNAACDSGVVESVKRTGLSNVSPFIFPYDSSFLQPTVQETLRSFKLLLLFDDCTSLAPLSEVYPDTAKVWEDYTHSAYSSRYVDSDALVASGEYKPAYFTPQVIVETVFQINLWIFRVLVWLGLAFAIKAIIDGVRASVGKHKHLFSKEMLYAILLFGVFLSFMIRIVLVAYIEVTNIQIGTYLMYLSSGGVVMMLFIALGGAYALEGGKHTVIEKED